MLTGQSVMQSPSAGPPVLVGGKLNVRAAIQQVAGEALADPLDHP
jgi:hypothetical protein